jgi:hypothetical protein
MTRPCEASQSLQSSSVTPIYRPRPLRLYLVDNKIDELGRAENSLHVFQRQRVNLVLFEVQEMVVIVVDQALRSAFRIVFGPRFSRRRPELRFTTIAILLRYINAMFFNKKERKKKKEGEKERDGL